MDFLAFCTNIRVSAIWIRMSRIIEMIPSGYGERISMYLPNLLLFRWVSIILRQTPAEKSWQNSIPIRILGIRHCSVVLGSARLTWRPPLKYKMIKFKDTAKLIGGWNLQYVSCILRGFWLNCLYGLFYDIGASVIQIRTSKIIDKTPSGSSSISANNFSRLSIRQAAVFLGKRTTSTLGFFVSPV